LRISISNNFTPGNISKKGAGVGLENIRKRLRLHYKMSDLLQVENHSGVFTVHISIPENNIHESQA